MPRSFPLRKNKYDYEPQRENLPRQIAVENSRLATYLLLSAQFCRTWYCVRLSDLDRKVNKIGLRMAKFFLRPVFYHFRPFLCDYGIFSALGPVFCPSALKNGCLPHFRSNNETGLPTLEEL